MPNCGGGVDIRLEAWDPKSFDPKPEDGKSLKLTTDKPEATSYATPKDPRGHRPSILGERYYKDKKYYCQKFLDDGQSFHLVRSGVGYFTPEYHITRPYWEEKRDEILEIWKALSLENNSPGSSPLSSTSSSDFVEPGRMRVAKEDPKTLALRQRELDAIPRPIALRVSVKFTNKPFEPNRFVYPDRRTRRDLCVNIFYNGEFVHSRAVNHRFSPKVKGQYCIKTFSGRSVGNRIEVPFIMLPSDQQDQVSGGPSTVTESNAQRWEKIGASLLAEANNWKSSDAPTAMNNAGNDKSIMTKYLEAIANLKLPTDLENTQENGKRKFGIIDVVVTAGIALNANDANLTTLVLREPRRLLSEGPIGKNETICAVGLHGGSKKKSGVGEQELASVANTRTGQSKKDNISDKMDSSPSADQLKSPESFINTEHPSRNTRSLQRTSLVANEDDSSVLGTQETVYPGTSAQSSKNAPRTSFSSLLTTSLPQRRTQGDVEYNTFEGAGNSYQAPFLGTRSHGVTSVNPTSGRAPIKLKLSLGKIQAIMNIRTQSTSSLPQSRTSQVSGELDIAPPPPKRRRQSEDTNAANAQDAIQLKERRRSSRNHGKAPTLAPIMSLPTQAANKEHGVAQTNKVTSRRPSGNSSKMEDAVARGGSSSSVVESSLNPPSHSRILHPMMPSTTRKNTAKSSFDDITPLTPVATTEVNKKDNASGSRKRKRVSVNDANSQFNGTVGSAMAKRLQPATRQSGVARRSSNRTASQNSSGQNEEAEDEGLPNVKSLEDGIMKSTKATVNSQDESLQEFTSRRPSSSGRASRSVNTVFKEPFHERLQVAPHENGTIDHSEGATRLEGGNTLEPTPSLPSSSHRASRSTRIASTTADPDTPWKPSALNDGCVLTFGTEVYNAENYKTDHVTRLPCRHGSNNVFQEREALFATTEILEAVRFVIDP